MPVKSLESLRQNLARADALLPLALVGTLSGAFSGLVIIAFRLFAESSFVTFGIGDASEDFEALGWPWRIGLPVIGGLAVGILMTSVSAGTRQVGVVHVMERLAQHAGRLPWRNAMLQFVAATVAIVSGHSVGREGPSIHIGAASASLLGQWLHLPNNSLRILVACGTAAAIAASFNTPIAGVIFAMEVVMMEYTLVGFTPVILAAVYATSMTRFVFGATPIVQAPAMQMASLLELPYMLLVGLVLGTMASLFITSVRRLDERARDFPLWLRTTAAGLITGLCAPAAPEIMGLGYDTVELTLVGALGLSALALIVAFSHHRLYRPRGSRGPHRTDGGHGRVGRRRPRGDWSPSGTAVQRLIGLLRPAGHGGDDGGHPAGAAGSAHGDPGAHRQPRQHPAGHGGHRRRHLDQSGAVRPRVHLHCRAAFPRPGVSPRPGGRCPRPHRGRRGHEPAFHHGSEARQPCQCQAHLRGCPRVGRSRRRGRMLATVNEDQLDRIIAGLDSDEAHESIALMAEHGQSCVAVRADATLREALDAMDRNGADVAVITGSSKRDSGIVYGILTREQIDAAVRYGG